MYGDLIDAGPYVGYLRSFGPPEVVALDDFAGNASTVELASGFWECVEAITFTLAAAAGGGTRLPRLRWFAGEAVPFAQAQATVGTAATNTSTYTFGIDLQPSGVLNSPTIVEPIPRLLFLPGWSLELDVAAGAAGDAVSGVRVYRRRYQLVELERD